VNFDGLLSGMTGRSDKQRRLNGITSGSYAVSRGVKPVCSALDSVKRANSTMPRAQTRAFGVAFDAPQLANCAAANVTCA